MSLHRPLSIPCLPIARVRPLCLHCDDQWSSNSTTCFSVRESEAAAAREASSASIFFFEKASPRLVPSLQSPQRPPAGARRGAGAIYVPGGPLFWRNSHIGNYSNPQPWRDSALVSQGSSLRSAPAAAQQRRADLRGARPEDSGADLHPWGQDSIVLLC